MSSKTQCHHHNLTTAVLAHEEKGVAQLTATTERFMNPSSDTHTDLFNLVNKAVMPETVSKDLGKQSEIGRRLFDCFLKERVHSGKVNLWSPMKRRKLLTWKTRSKVMKVTAADKIVELQEDRSLFARDDDGVQEQATNQYQGDCRPIRIFDSHFRKSAEF